MLTIHRYSFSRSIAWILLLGSAAVLLSSAGAATAQVTQVYSFEPDLEGFVFNGGGLAVSHETSGLGVTDGLNSMKLEFADFSTFAGALTSNVHPEFTNPLGVDFVRFDFTNTNRFVPPDPQPGMDPTFANASITFFGQFTGDPGAEAQIQFFFSEEPIGALEPGSHEVEIDLTTGGLHTQTGDIKGYDEFLDAGFVPSGFQIYINKSGQFMNPDFAWTVYIDNIRVGRLIAGIPGDFNEDGSVDAADYVVWRKSEGTENALPNDNGLGTPIGAEHYNLWRTKFGAPAAANSSASAVPEPASALVLIVAGVCWHGTKRRRTAAGLALLKNPDRKYVSLPSHICPTL